MSNAKHFDFFFCDSWMTRFKARLNLHTFWSHGDSGDADVSAATNCLEDFGIKLQGYALGNIYNADECRLNYRMTPD